MIKTGYRLVKDGDLPDILQTTVEDPACVSWREVKKQLRSWYLQEAGKLRGLSEKDFNG